MKQVSKEQLNKVIARVETKLEKAKEQLDDNSTDNRAATKTLLTLTSDILLAIASNQSLEYRQEIVDEIADILDISDFYSNLM